MTRLGNYTFLFNPWGPRLVISHSDERGQLLLAVGGWFQGRKAWPKGRYFSLEHYP